MTSKEIANKTWTLWCDYYKDGDLSNEEILNIIESDIDRLIKKPNIEIELGANSDRLIRELRKATVATEKLRMVLVDTEKKRKWLNVLWLKLKNIFKK